MNECVYHALLCSHFRNVDEGRKVKTEISSIVSMEERENASLLFWCDSLFPLQLSSQLKTVCLNTTANFSERSHVSHTPGMAGFSNETFLVILEVRNGRYCAGIGKKNKVKAVSPSWRPCLGKTEAHPVSDSWRSRSLKILTVVPERTC